MIPVLTLLIDNYDSYTYNLYQLIAQVNQKDPVVRLNDEYTAKENLSMQPDNIVISPGPGRPDRIADFGQNAELIAQCGVPVLGVCLGHQGIASLCGASIQPLQQPVHGQADSIWHDDTLFDGIPQGFQAIRYHSLHVTEPLPAMLKEIAWNSEGLVMGLRHRQHPWWGVQFHPESIGSQHGLRLLENFRRLTREFQQGRPHPINNRRIFTSAHSTSHLASSSAASAMDCQLKVERFHEWMDPATVFVQLFATETNAFWLDTSDAQPGDARFSIMGSSTEILSHRVGNGSDSLFESMKQRLNRKITPPANYICGFVGGWVGALGYELKNLHIPEQGNRSEIPDALLLWVERFLVFDHQRQALMVCSVDTHTNTSEQERWRTEVLNRLGNPLKESNGFWFNPTKPLQTTQPVLTTSKQDYLNQIRKAQQWIRQGETYQLCLTNQYRLQSNLNPVAYYLRLRRHNPAPYSAFLKLGTIAVACSSPERFLQVDAQKRVETKPIKGTIRRGQHPEQDQRLVEALRNDPKERGENLMIVDLLRNDLGKVCQTGSVRVPSLMALESYATLHQLVSTVTGTLKPELDAVDCFRSIFPGGSMTGTPKHRSLQLLDRLEGRARGIYSGSIGYFSLNGQMDCNIVIRTAVFDQQQITIGTGGGITVLSDPEREFEEIELKAKILLALL